MTEPKSPILLLLLAAAVVVLGVVVFLLTRGGPRPFVPPAQGESGPGDAASSAPPPTDAPSDWRPSEEVLAFIRAGDAIQAIKAVREETGLGLRDAKRIVDSLAASGAAGVSVPMRGSPEAVASYRPDASTLALVREGRKLEAIVAVREATGMGLKEAKEYVEALERAGR